MTAKKDSRSAKSKTIGTGAEPSAVERTEAALGLIARENGDLNAFVRVIEAPARAEAKAADLLSAAGLKRGPLHGLPLAVKDIIDVAGVPSGCGSLTRAKAPPAEADAHVVAKLRAAGAVVVGKTHTVEFAFGGWGSNETVGAPKNPWDRKVHRVPGGSSSGSGVAVGAGLVPIAFGTDTGGSVRIPAALCGCVGLKTSIGLVGRSGVAPLSETLDTIGPITQTVRQAADFLMAMQGPDAKDPSTEAWRHVDALSDLERGVAGLRLGRVADEDLPLTSPEMREAFSGAVRLLEQAGAKVTPFRMPQSFEESARGTGIFISTEAYAYYRKLADDPASGLADPIRRRMMAGKTTSVADYVTAVAAKRAAIARFLSAMDRLDAILLPTIPYTAIPLADIDENKAHMAAHTRWVNYLDMAGLAVPISLTKAGLPTSLQIVVRRFDDALALRIGQAFETARGPFPTALERGA